MQHCLLLLALLLLVLLLAPDCELWQQHQQHLPVAFGRSDSNKYASTIWQRVNLKGRATKAAVREAAGRQAGRTTLKAKQAARH